MRSVILVNQPSKLFVATFDLDQGQHWLLGRSSQYDVVLPHPSVSRKHAQIDADPNGLTVRDLDSRNGTFIDGDRVRHAPLSVGQTLRLGDLSFLLTAGDLGMESEIETQGERDAGVAPAEDPILDQLSSAQHRVLQLILTEGLSDKKIASRLHISPNTVHNHLSEIYRIFNVHSRSELLVRLHQKPDDAGFTRT